LLLDFFAELRAAGIPVSLPEYLTLLEALDGDVIERTPEAFHALARAALVKDEALFDRYDLVFARVFKGLGETALNPQELPEDWLRRLAERNFTEEEKRAIEALGGFDALMQALRERLAEQRGRHQGGSKWIGTAGASPFGAYGYNPEGVRIGQEEGREGRAVKVWDERRFRDLDGDREIGTRNFRVALRRLRRFAREGAPEELDLDGTVRATADRGHLDLLLRPERRNVVRLLLFLDVGGSMDWHIRVAEELFSAVRAEFRTLRSFYFHNCLYESVWEGNARRHAERVPTLDILRTYSPETRVLFVGDASMSPYELTRPGGSVEHWNEEAGSVWLERVLRHFRRVAWLNPLDERAWKATWTVGAIAGLFGDRMYPLTVDGLDRAMRALSR